jgi:hypothetical protein
MTMRPLHRPFFLLALLLVGVQSLSAQIAPVVARTATEQAECRRLPLVRRTYALGGGHADIHRDSLTGKSCVIPPAPASPVAVVVNSLVICPLPDSMTWRRYPASAIDIPRGGIDSIRPVRDSTQLAALACAVRPKAALHIFLAPGIEPASVIRATPPSTVLVEPFKPRPMRAVTSRAMGGG